LRLSEPTAVGEDYDRAQEVEAKRVIPVIQTCRHDGVIDLFITKVRVICDRRAQNHINRSAAILFLVFHRNGEGALMVGPAGHGRFLMSFRSSEATIDEIVASCNGDLRGAVRALLLVNEHLEAELAELYAAAAHSGLTERRNSVLH